MCIWIYTHQPLHWVPFAITRLDTVYILHGKDLTVLETFFRYFGPN